MDELKIPAPQVDTPNVILPADQAIPAPNGLTDTQQTHSQSSSRKKYIIAAVVALLVVAAIVVVGIAVQKPMTSPVGSHTAMAPNGTSPQATNAADATSSANSTDTQLTNDERALDQSMQNIDTSLSGVDSGLNDKQTNLTY